jgi:hypothetical protein
MGYVAKRGTRAKPLYYAQYKDLDGRYRMRRLKGARSQEDALKALARIEARIAEGKPAFEPPPVPVPPVVEGEGEAAIGPLLERWAGLPEEPERGERPLAGDSVDPAGVSEPDHGPRPAARGGDVVARRPGCREPGPLRPVAAALPRPAVAVLLLGDRAGPRGDQPGADDPSREAAAGPRPGGRSLAAGGEDVRGADGHPPGACEPDVLPGEPQRDAPRGGGRAEDGRPRLAA